MTEDESRKQFEAWISGPPFEYDIERYPENRDWAGSYMNLGTDLAWHAWQAARTGETVQYAAFWKSSGNMIPSRMFTELGDAVEYRKRQFEQYKIEIRKIRISVGEVVK
jgi:hypothetical protein